MNSLLRGMSLLPGIFWTTGSERVKDLSGKLAKQTTEIESLKNNLLNKNWECDLQASQLAAKKVAQGNLRMQLESKADNLRRQGELVNSVIREAQTRAQKHTWEVKQLKNKIDEMSETFDLKSSYLSNEKAEVGRLSVELKEQASRIVEQGSQIKAQAIEIRDYKSEIGEKSKAIKDLQKDIQGKAILLREHEKTIEGNALEIQKKSKILLEQEKQIAHNTSLIQTITQKWKELREHHEKETQKLKDLQEDSQKQTQKMKFLQEYNKLSTKKIYNLERNLDVKTRAINELNSNMKIRNNMIRKLEHTIKDHIKIQKEMQMKQLDLQSQITEVKYVPARVEEQEEDVCAPAGGLINAMKRGRENKSRTITRSSKRFRKTED